MMTLLSKNKIKSVFFNLIQMKQPQLMHVNSSIYIRSIIVNVDVTKYIYNAPCDDSSVIFVKIKINRMNYFCRKYYKFWQKNHYSQKILDVQYNFPATALRC
jgi:hypothetical protein